MKRRALIVGSALASVGALLGVGKAAEEVSQPEKTMTFPPEMFQIKQPGPMAWDAEAVQEAQLAAIREQPWYQAMLRRRVLGHLGWSDGTVQEIVTDPAPEWLEMNASLLNPQPYRLRGPDSRRAGI